MISQGERNVRTVKNMYAGAGEVVIESLLGANELNEKCGLFARVTLAKGCELGYHTHHGETETYYILSGRGIYDDNGVKLSVNAGDVFFCRDGCGHAISNTGDESLGFIALIIKG